MTPIGESAIRGQLERILASEGFARNERLSRFLRFVVEQHAEGRDCELKETVIATEVFGRRPDYNPKQDAVVRTEAARLRARLNEYYLADGGSDQLVIELPKGGYVPSFRIRQAPPTAGGSYKRPRAPLAILAAALALVIAFLGWWGIARKNAPITIAVLPLENLKD